MEDEEWKESIAEGGILHDTIQQLISEDSKKEEAQSTISSIIQNVTTTCARRLGLSN
ncbi:hypothetical protein [Wolbachia endosymbiont (group B) of Episyrphus balteatus]|nr:hypothetical protein [Wolbachia endosymbiont (group B) of Episyrphus balteatus]